MCDGEIGCFYSSANTEEFGLAIRETSLCLWLAGDTKPHKDALKKAGAKWSAKKGAWYFRKQQAA